MTNEEVKKVFAKIGVGAKAFFISKNNNNISKPKWACFFSFAATRAREENLGFLPFQA